MLCPTKSSCHSGIVLPVRMHIGLLPGSSAYTSRSSAVYLGSLLGLHSGHWAAPETCQRLLASSTEMAPFHTHKCGASAPKQPCMRMLDHFERAWTACQFATLPCCLLLLIAARPPLDFSQVHHVCRRHPCSSARCSASVRAAALGQRHHYCACAPERCHTPSKSSSLSARTCSATAPCWACPLGSPHSSASAWEVSIPL